MTGWPAYSFLEQAAAEARAESRRYWGEGGAADKKWPMQPSPGWRLPAERKGAKLDAALKRHHGGKP